MIQSKARKKPETQVNRQVKRLTGDNHMLNWALTFLVVAIIAAILGFGGVAGVATEIAKILFVIFIVLFLISLITGFRARRQ